MKEESDDTYRAKKCYENFLFDQMLINSWHTYLKLGNIL